MTNWSDTIYADGGSDFCVTVQVELYCHLCGVTHEQPEQPLGLLETGEQALSDALKSVEHDKGWGSYHDGEGDSHAVCGECLQRLRDGWNPDEEV